MRFEKVARAESGIVFIKIADHIDNLAFLDVFPPDKQQRKQLEIKADYLPLYERVVNSFDPELRKKYEK